MRKSLRKGLIIGVVLIMSLGILCACNKSPKHSPDARGQFYTLQTAYDNGFISLEDLKTMAEILNNHQTLDIKDVDADVAKAVRALYYNELCDSTDEKGKTLYPKANINDLKTIWFYGKYNDCYCFRIYNPYVMYPEWIEEETIEGITFYYTGPQMIVWKDNDIATDK